jgi:hypothetical protein
MDKGLGSGGHIREFLPHAVAVVDHQADRDRHVFVSEQAGQLETY